MPLIISGALSFLLLELRPGSTITYMSKIVNITIVAVFLMFLGTTSSHADMNPMTNTPCKKSGDRTHFRFMQYKCQTFQGKMVWRPFENTGEIQASPVLKFMNAEFVKLSKRLDQAPSFDGYSLEVENSVSKYLWTKDMKQSLNIGFKLMKMFGPVPEKPVKVFIFWNDNFVDGKLPAFCKSTGGGVSCAGDSMTGQLKWFSESRNHPNTDPDRYYDETQRFYIFGHFAHEANHITQHETFRQQGDPNVYEIAPAWLREGGPEFFKILAYAYQYRTTYSFARNLYVKNIGSRCDVVSINLLGDDARETQGCEYNNGMMAAEYLAWQKRDIAAPLSFYLNGKRDDGMSISFEKVYGIPLRLFSSKVDEYISKQTP